MCPCSVQCNTTLCLQIIMFMQVWYLLSSVLVPQMPRKLSVFQNRSSRVETAKRFWTLEDGTSRLSLTSVRNYQHSPRNNAEERGSLFVSDYVRRLICMFHMAGGSAAGLILINKAFIYFSLMNNKRFLWSTLPPCTIIWHFITVFCSVCGPPVYFQHISIILFLHCFLEVHYICWRQYIIFEVHSMQSSVLMSSQWCSGCRHVNSN